MSLRLELPAVEGEIVPGQFLIADVYAVDRMVYGDVGPYWPAIVIQKSLAPLKVERRQEASIATHLPVKLDNEHLVWLVARNKL